MLSVAWRGAWRGAARGAVRGRGMCSARLPPTGVWSVHEAVRGEGAVDVDEGALERVSKLAHVRVPAADAPRVEAEFRQMLSFVARVRSVDLGGVQPLRSLLEEQPALVRDGTVVSEAGSAESARAVLQNAPAAQRGFFAVPKVGER